MENIAIMENSNENTMVNVTEQVEKALAGAIAVPQVTNSLRWPTPEDYRKETNKRFRMTKEEQTKFTNDASGRQLAFEARQIAGLL
jgi:hypothetical protein